MGGGETSVVRPRRDQQLSPAASQTPKTPNSAPAPTPTAFRRFPVYRSRAWAKKPSDTPFIKRTLLVNSVLLLLRCIAAWTPEIRSKINKRPLPSTITPPCAVCLKIGNASHISTAVATAGLPCTPAVASR